MSDIRYEILQYKPDIVGITCTSVTAKQVAQVAKIAKEAVCAKTVIGGPHPSVDPVSLLRDFDEVDITVQSEGEITFVDLVQHLETGSDLRNVRGITFRDGGKIVTNKSRSFLKLDELPLPSWDIFPSYVWRNYWSPKASRFPIATLQSNRGCPYDCIFCNEPDIFGGDVRFRNPSKVVDEIEYDMKFGIKELAIVDSAFTLWPKRAHEICDEIIARGLDISWFCNSRVDTINASLIRKMKKAGCHRVYFGVETGSEETLKLVNKGTTLYQATKAIRLGKDAGMHVEAGFILGLPGEKRTDIDKTVRFAATLNADTTQFSILLPLPGTTVYDMAQQMGIELPSYFEGGFNVPKVTLCSLSVNELVKAQKWAYRCVYFRPSYVMSQLAKNKSLFRIRSDISRLLRFIGYMSELS